MRNQVMECYEIIEEVKAFLPKLIEACESVSELFYQTVNDETWESFGQVVQGMDDLYKTLNLIKTEFSDSGQDSVLLSVVVRSAAAIAEKFAQLNEHVDDEQYIAASDDIRHELTPLFQELQIALGGEWKIKERLFTANMKYLKKQFPRIHDQMTILEQDRLRYQITYAANGTPNMYLTDNTGQSIYMYSKYNPQYEAERWVESITDSIIAKPNVILYGFGLGYHVSRISEIYPDHRIYVYEPDEQIFLAALREVDLASILSSENIKDLVVGHDKKQRDQMFYRFLGKVRGETATIAMPIFDKINPQQKREFIEDAKMAILNYMASNNIHDKVGLKWTQNALNNASVTINTPSISGLENKLDGITAVIVGAGPSLKVDIENLRKLKNQAFIIAAGSSIQALLHHGIEPHLIVTMDGKDVNYKAFSVMASRSIPLLFVPQVEYRIVENKTANLFHVFFNTDVLTRFVLGVSKADPVFDSNHSVTGTAIQAAIFMGCKEIVFTGQDFSYPGGEVYSTGAAHISEQFSERLVKAANVNVPNVQGTLNRTTEALKITRVDIEELIEKHPDIHFVNSSSLGAQIKHTTFEPLETVMDKLQGQQLDGDFFEQLMSRYLTNYDETRKKGVIERIHHFDKQLDEIDGKLKRVQKHLYRLPELSRSKPLKCLNVMVSIEEEWEKIVKSITFNTLFLTAIRNDIHNFDRNLPEMADEKNVIKKAAMFCEILGALVNTMQEKLPEIKSMVEEAMRRIEARNGNIAVEVNQ